ncbi:hypothetical protein [Burkholderia mayonis]|uniref:hypothetical protein n=1 Tax=Burkholderia mayonis TaxID=1385591 RepID=UPI00131F00BE|nr:hypothetical protein [Burkholderia mayonis]
MALGARRSVCDSQFAVRGLRSRSGASQQAGPHELGDARRNMPSVDARRVARMRVPALRIVTMSGSMPRSRGAIAIPSHMTWLERRHDALAHVENPVLDELFERKHRSFEYRQPSALAATSDSMKRSRGPARRHSNAEKRQRLRRLGFGEHDTEAS